jgi:hypothetical protein
VLETRIGAMVLVIVVASVVSGAESEGVNTVVLCCEGRKWSLARD